MELLYDRKAKVVQIGLNIHKVQYGLSQTIPKELEYKWSFYLARSVND